MSSVIESLERAQLRRVPSFVPGDRVKVHFQVVEGTRRRIQVFEGVVIKRQGHGARETFTVRKQSFGVGVERTFPLHSPKIERIELTARGEVRRAKLYYLRDRVGKRARVRERRYIGPEDMVESGLLHERDEPTDAEGVTAEEALSEGAQTQAVESERAESDAQEEASESRAPESGGAESDAQEEAPESRAPESEVEERASELSAPEPAAEDPDREAAPESPAPEPAAEEPTSAPETPADSPAAAPDEADSSPHAGDSPGDPTA